MKKEKNETGNGLFSFMDLMFGTLGAVVLLLLITLTQAGPTEKIRDQAERTLVWKIVVDKGRIDNVDLQSNGFSLLPYQTKITVNGARKTVEIQHGKFTVAQTQNDKQSEYIFTASCEKDELLESLSDISVQFGGDTAFSLHSVDVSIFPSEGEKGQKILEKETFPTSQQQYTLQMKLELYNKDDGKMPEIKAIKFL